MKFETRFETETKLTNTRKTGGRTQVQICNTNVINVTKKLKIPSTNENLDQKKKDKTQISKNQKDKKGHRSHELTGVT